MIGFWLEGTKYCITRRRVSHILSFKYTLVWLECEHLGSLSLFLIASINITVHRAHIISEMS